MLGIVTRWMQHETTQAAIMLAEEATSRGESVSILAREICNRDVAAGWDSKVVNENKNPFVDWKAQCDHIIWTQVPPPTEIWHAKECGITTTVLIDCEQLAPQHGQALRALDNVILPFRSVSKAVNRVWKLKTVRKIIMPWTVPVSIGPSRELSATMKTVFLPLYDSQCMRCKMAIFAMMDRVLKRDDTKVIVGVGRAWSRDGRKAVRALRRKYGERFDPRIRPDILHRLLLFGQSDITVWPSRFESFGIVGLTSLHMGTPVIAWDVSPQNEFLRGWKNSVLVKGKTRRTWLGMDLVDDDYEQFSGLLLNTLQDDALLAKMKASSTVGLETRRKQFRAGWDELTK